MEICEKCGQERELRDAIVGKTETDNAPIWRRVCDECVVKILTGQ